MAVGIHAFSSILSRSRHASTGYTFFVHPKRPQRGAAIVIVCIFALWATLIFLYWTVMDARNVTRGLIKENVDLLEKEILEKMDGAIWSLDIHLDVVTSDVEGWYMPGSAVPRFYFKLLLPTVCPSVGGVLVVVVVINYIWICIWRSANE